jgi:hypothetical protein
MWASLWRLVCKPEKLAKALGTPLSYIPVASARAGVAGEFHLLPAGSKISTVSRHPWIFAISGYTRDAMRADITWLQSRGLEPKPVFTGKLA